MPDIIHRIGIKTPMSQVLSALTRVEGLAGWWTDEASGDPRQGGTLTFPFRSPTGTLVGEMVMEVTEVAPARVAWRCVQGPPDWVGTTFTFDLAAGEGMTILVFGHRGWAESTESMAHCSMKWAVFLLSLRELVETGKGRPSPGDLKIDDWN
jgi:uncharacterized protein YndB with AHSA1/START domain